MIASARHTAPPRRIVFSRKGFDSVAGGCPSPIVDGRPVSLPIPAGRYPGGRPYRDLAGKRAQLVASLSRGRLNEADLCHLDPDIEHAALAGRPAGWRGAFGQVGAAQGHLRNQGVGIGDLFLFFGLFQAYDSVTTRLIGTPRHAVFGWLRVGAIVTEAGVHRWLADHPHAAHGWPASNTIYLAADTLALPGAEDLPGSGVFARAAALTAVGERCTTWSVPPWLERSRMSYRHADRYWPAPGRMDARGQWQEGVAVAAAEAVAWAGALIAEHAA